MKKDEITKLEEKVARDPRSTLFVRLSEEYRKEGRLDEAIDVLKNGLEAQPGYMSARVALGRIYLEKGMHDEARGVFEIVVEAIPDNLFARQRLADIYQEQGELEKAREQVEEIIRLNPTVFDGERFRNDLGPRLVSTGWSQASAGPVKKPGDADDDAETGLRIPDSGPLGMAPSDTGVADDENAGENLGDDPETAPADTGDGEVSDAMGDGESVADEPGPGATGDNGDAGDGTPETREQRILTESMAKIYIQQGHYEKALDVYEKLYETHPESKTLLQQVSDLRMLIALTDEQASRQGERRREAIVGRLNALLGRVKRWSGGTA